MRAWKVGDRFTGGTLTGTVVYVQMEKISVYVSQPFAYTVQIDGWSGPASADVVIPVWMMNMCTKVEE